MATRLILAGIGAVLAFVGWLWRRSDAAKPAEEGKKKKRLRAKPPRL